MVNEKQHGCGCGRSPTGVCIGLHKLTNEEYKVYLKEAEEKKKQLNEQSKPQLLQG